MADTRATPTAALAVTRFGLGARPGELERVGADPIGWLKAQIRPAGADQPELSPEAVPPLGERFTVLAAYRASVRNAASIEGEGAPRQMRREALAPIRAAYAADVLARARLACLTEAGFRERWARFWTNHFTVSARGIQLVAAVGPFEREAIRPHVFGPFETLLKAAIRHPGMLLYLDQAQSAGPGSPAGRRLGRGLNENLAREILELHTVGADSGYGQADVVEFARALTGWSVGGPATGPRAGAFLYRAALHEPGAREVMGRRYPPRQAGQAEAILTDLAAHPATARRLARKLAAHFVADEPPPSLVDRLAAAWSSSRGDLAVVAQALVEAPEAWSPAAAKLKTPEEFITSAYRAAGAAPTMAAREVLQPLTVLGQRPFSAPQPNGWSDLARDWAAPDAVLKRLTWARAFAQRQAPLTAAPGDVARAVLGERLSGAAATAVARAESRTEAFALLLMSPEFQRR